MNTSMQFADLVSILDSYRRGDYWAAVSRAVALINSVLNPTVGSTLAVVPASGLGTTRFAVAGEPAAEDWDSVLSELESTTDGVESFNGNLSAPNPDQSRLDSQAVSISPTAVIFIFKTLLELFSKYRKQNATENSIDKVTVSAPKSDKFNVNPGDNKGVTVANTKISAPVSKQ